jgi:hypothetical protein
MSFSHLEVCFATKFSVKQEALNILCLMVLLEISEKKKCSTIELHDQAEKLLGSHIDMFLKFEGLYAPLKDVFGPKFITHNITANEIKKVEQEPISMVAAFMKRAKS